MGEYARVIGSPGGEVKIGTCENMLYLRWDQRHRVDYNFEIEDGTCPFRFRFPWPDEDNVEPGMFDDPFKRLRVDIAPPEGFEHGIVQFVASSAGYNVCLPCPEGPSDHGLTVHRNGFAGSSFLTQQRLINGRLCAIFQCACGWSWNAPTLEHAAPACEALLRRAETYDEIDRETGELTTHGQRLVEISRRIRQGYEVEVPA